jgi:hypothetical protein
MQLRFPGNRLTLQHLLHQIDTPARAIQLVAQQLVSRASGEAETTVDASAHYRFRLLAFRRVFDEIREMGLH